MKKVPLEVIQAVRRELGLIYCTGISPFRRRSKLRLRPCWVLSKDSPTVEPTLLSIFIEDFRKCLEDRHRRGQAVKYWFIMPTPDGPSYVDPYIGVLLEPKGFVVPLKKGGRDE